MNNRERFHAAMAFEPVDRVCHIEHGFWDETYARWKGEGLPGTVQMPGIEYLGTHPDLYDHFGLTRYSYILRSQYFLPPFETSVIEETEQYRVVRDQLGRTIKEGKLIASLPQYLDFAIKTMDDYEALKERLAPKLNERYPANWSEIAQQMRVQTDYLVCTHMDGFFGYPRELLGAEQMLMIFYTDPELIRRMIEDRCEFYMQVYERAIRDAVPDFAFIWEDMSYCNGPLISPGIFREFLLPSYQRLTDFLRGVGVKTVIVDSDGDVDFLIPLLFPCVLTGLLPFEVKAGMDVVRIGQQYPKLQMIGGINKHVLEKGPKEIDAEVRRVVPAMRKRGGYAAALDHWVQPEIPLANYEYFVEKVRSV